MLLDSWSEKMYPVTGIAPPADRPGRHDENSRTRYGVIIAKDHEPVSQVTFPPFSKLFTPLSK